jgi:hypothetical protein
MTPEEVIQELREYLQYEIKEQDNAPHVYVEVADILEILNKLDDKQT